MRGNIRVISLDLDGVLFDGPSAAFPIAQQLGLGEKFMTVYAKVAKAGSRFEDSIIEGCKIWRGVKTEGVYNHLVNELPLRIGAQETVDTLKEEGYTVGCISSGVSQFFMIPFSKRLGLALRIQIFLVKREVHIAVMWSTLWEAHKKLRLLLNSSERKDLRENTSQVLEMGLMTLIYSISQALALHSTQKRKKLAEQPVSLSTQRI